METGDKYNIPISLMKYACEITADVAFVWRSLLWSFMSAVYYFS